MSRRVLFISFWVMLPVAAWAVFGAANRAEQRRMIDAIDAGSIFAWSRHITGQDPNDMNDFDKFESVAVIPGRSQRANGDIRLDDEVWVVVRRMVDGNEVRFVEQFQPLDWGPDPNYCWFVDCGLAYTESNGVTPTVGAYPTLQELSEGPLEALNTFADYTQGGDAPWSTDPSGFAVSGTIIEDQTSSMSIAVQDIGALAFHWKVSSEEGYDSLQLCIDDVLIDEISGELDWNAYSFSVETPGIHTIRWTYQKDESESEGSDCGWIKLVTWTPTGIPEGPDPPADTVLVGPISVTTPAGLQNMTPGNHYSIDSDIDLAGFDWTPLSWNLTTNAIVIEGNDHTISNLTLGAGAAKRGFIGSIGGTSTFGSGGGQIRNLKFSNCSVSGGDDTAVFCGWFYPKDYYDHGRRWLFENITISDSTVTVTTGADVGILFGECATEVTSIVGCAIEDCTITTNGNSSYIGSLIGNLNCTAYEPIEAESLFSQVRDCTASGTLNLTGPVLLYCGGLIGGCAGRTELAYVIDSSSTVNIVGTITANTGHMDAIGGFIGNPKDIDLISCSSTGSLAFTNGNYTGAYLNGVGGFAGASSSLNRGTNCYSTGSITVNGTADWTTIKNIGGFTGMTRLEDTWLRCYSTSSLTVNNGLASLYCIGGFCGDVDSGQAGSIFSRCWSEGDMTFNGNITVGDGGSGEDAGYGYGFIGGFIGYWDHHDTIMGQIGNCYTWSSIVCNGTYPANLTVGGFIAGWGADINDLEIINCYCAQTDTEAGSGLTGQIAADGDPYGFGGGGTDANIVTAAIYYDQQTSSLLTSAIAAAETTAWLQTKTNFEAAGWDFDSIWTMPESAAPWTGASYMAGLYDCVYADGRPIGSFLVEPNGALDLKADYHIIIAGLNYFSIFETMPLGANGTTRRPNAIGNVELDVYETDGVHVGSDMAHSAEWTFWLRNHLTGSARDPNDGTVALPYSGNTMATGDVVRIYGTTNYNGIWTLATDTNNLELRIPAPYTAETFDGPETVDPNEPIVPYTGFKGPVPFMRGTTRDPTVYMWEFDPIPLTIRAIMLNMETTVE